MEDTSGLLLAVVVHPPDVQDRDGARLALEELGGRFSRLRLIWADGGYRGATLSGWVQERLGCRLEIVARKAGQRGFAVLPRRWAVARTFEWLSRQRRLSKDYWTSSPSPASPYAAPGWGTPLPTSSTWPRPKLSELIPSGGQTRFDNRIRWGRHYLRQAGPVKLQDKAYAILPAGHQLLASETGDISGQALKRLTSKPTAPDPLDGAPTTPEEIVDAADQEM